MSASINAISDKLSKLKQLDTSFKVFGSIVHQYKTGPSIISNKVVEIEKKIGVALPKGYRSFLTKIGDGGVGPYYGIFPLEDALDKCRQWVGNHHLLAKNFPLKSDVEFASECNPPPSYDQHVYMLENDGDYEKRWDRVIEKYSSAAWFAGTLPLCEYGCGDHFFIVIQGETPDTVWVRSPDTGLYSLEINFLEWYERWLDDSLERVKVGDYHPHNKTYNFLEFGNNDKYGSNPWPKEVKIQ